MQRSKLPYFFLGLAAVIALAALAVLVTRPGVPSKVPAAVQTLSENPLTPPSIEKPATPENPASPRTAPAAGGASALRLDAGPIDARALDVACLELVGTHHTPARPSPLPIGEAKGV